LLNADLGNQGHHAEASPQWIQEGEGAGRKGSGRKRDIYLGVKKEPKR